jgi:hypothetical protein
MKTLKVAIDQYGNRFYFSTVKELREQISGRCSRLFQDSKDGTTYHVGYRIGEHWLNIYEQVRKEI